MCTVTFLPLGKNDFILTSNRDETPLRKTIPPLNYTDNGVALIYPKDELAGGTWIGISAKKRLVCLLNGAFTNHLKKKEYKMSRGIMVKEILSSDSGVAFIHDFDFTDIEPFTLILVEYQKELEIYELVWDGTTKHFIKLAEEPKIWSSSTLYSDEMKQLRKDWFANWLQENTEFHQAKILAFHQSEHLGNTEISLKMKRSFVETVSTTSIKKENDTIEMKYIDFLKEETKIWQTK